MKRFDEAAAKWGRDYPAGTVVFKQGAPGDAMYFIHAGTVGITREHGGFKHELAWLKKGDFFGEMALVDGSPRSASATCLTPCKIIPIPRAFLERFNQANSDFLLLLLEALIVRIETTTLRVHRKYALPEDDAHEPRSREFLEAFAQAADHSHYRRFGPGDPVITQGEAGDLMYIILDGKVAVSRQDQGAAGQAGGKLTVLAQLGRGDFFGEMALVSGNPRLASVTALSPLVVMPVDRALFLKKVREAPGVARHLVRVLILRLRHLLESLD